MTFATQERAVALLPKTAHNSLVRSRMLHFPRSYQAPVRRFAHTWRSLLAVTVHRSGERSSSVCSFPFKTTRRAPRPSRLPLLEETEFGEKGRTLRFAVGFASSQQADCSQQSQRG